MEGLIKTTERKEEEEEFSFKRLFVPLTTLKAIHWIIIIGLLVFGNALFNGFVWDDKPYIISNPDIHSGNFFQLIRQNIFNVGLQYRPIPALYFAALYHFASGHPFFYHLLQLTIHVINTSLLFVFLNYFLKKKYSLFLSLMFLIHPIQVESVSYIASSDNPLFFLAGMTALLLSMREEISLKRYFAIFGLLLLSLLTKETAILFIFVILLYRFIFRKGKVNLWAIFSLVTLLVYLLIRLGFGGTESAKSAAAVANLSLTERLINIPAVIFYYLKTLFLPVQLAVQQDWVIRTIDLSHFYFPLFIDMVFFLLLVIFGLYLLRSERRSFRSFIFFLFWFLAGLSMHLQLYPLDWTVADRWFYFPIAGLLGMTGVVIQILCNANKKIQYVILTIWILFVTILSLRTVVRNTDWSDNLTLYMHDSKIYDSYYIENEIGGEYINLKQYDDALNHYLKSVAIYSYNINLYNTGYAYQLKGSYSNAESYYYKSLHGKKYPNTNSLITYRRLGIVLLLQKKYQQTINIINQALSEYPKDVNLLLIIAVSEYNLHDQKEALSAVSKAKMISNDSFTNSIYLNIVNKQPIQISNN